MAEPLIRTRPTDAAPGVRTESIPGLIRDIRDQLTLLLRQEVALAKAELSEKTSRIARDCVLLVSGGLAAFAGLIFILHSVTAMVSKGLHLAGMEQQAPWLAPLLVGLVVLFGSSFCIRKGLAAMKTESLVPEKTLGSLKEDKEWMQSKVS